MATYSAPCAREIENKITIKSIAHGSVISADLGSPVSTPCFENTQKGQTRCPGKYFPLSPELPVSKEAKKLTNKSVSRCFPHNIKDNDRN